MDLFIKTDFKELVQQAFFSIPTFATEILELELHSEQAICLDLMRNKKEIAIHSGNRWGKGDLIKIFGAYLAMYKPVAPQFKSQKIPILNTSITQDQANIVFDKFIATLLDKPKFSWAIEKVTRQPFPCIFFKTGVEWWFRNASQNGKYLEGRSYFWANFDEADLQDNFHSFVETILSPRIWDFGGPLSWTTTPRRGKKNSYQRISALNAKIKAGQTDLLVFQGDSRKNSFLHPDVIEKMNELPPKLFNKNVLGLFEDSCGIVSHETIQNARLIASGLRKGNGRGFHINAWDLARKSTFNVGVSIETSSPLQLVSWERTQDKEDRSKTYWSSICQRIKERHEQFPGITCIDATGIGDVINSFIPDVTPRVAFIFTPQRKKALIETGLACLESTQIGIPFDLIHQTINGVYWSAEDEFIDFDPETCDKIPWDFVCAVFMAIAIFKNTFQTSILSSKAMPPPMLSGLKKYAY